MNKQNYRSVLMRMLLIIPVMIACLILFPSAAHAKTNSCGDNAEYELSGGVLTITGTGEMSDFSSASTIPWKDHKDSITKVIIDEGITSIGSYAFYGCTSLSEVTIPKSVTSINVNAFLYCERLSIWGYANSTAQTFAEEQNIPFYYLSGSLSNFTSFVTYTGFHDVKSTSWYSDSVKKAVEIGLMKGLNSTTFNPGGNLTLAETITLASRIHSIYYTGSDSFESGTPWYQPYVDYAVENGIIIMQYNYTKSATRAQFAEIMAAALPDNALPAYNETDDGGIPDVSMSNYAAEEIYKLYRAGIIVGNEKGEFLPNNSITRAEASAIVTRVAIPEQRLGYDPKIIIKDTPIENDSIADTELVFGDLDYFIPVDTYDGFSDVKTNSWYYENVKKSVEIDLLEGESSTSFNPSGNITIGQSITLASRIYSIYYTGSQSFTIGNPWYKVYVKYALDNGIINQVYDYTKPATRAEFSEIISGALPETALPVYNEVSDGDIPDVSIAEDDYAAEEIYMLYRAGIIGGKTDGYFHPDSTITRAEASAIITRIAIPDLRLGYDPLISTGDDSKKVIFKGKTIDDFPSELVINFDDAKDNNFGVLSEDVICLNNSANLNLASHLEDGTYLITNPDNIALNLKIGDVVKTVDEYDNAVLFKVAGMSTKGDSLIITPAAGTMLSEYYQYLKVDTTATVGAAANSRAARSVSEGNSSPNITFIPGGLQFGATLNNDNYTLGLTGKVMVDFKIAIEYDPVLFGKDYFYMDVKNTTTSTAALTGSLKAGKETGILTDELDLGRLPVQTTIPGVEVELELTLPVKFEAEASIKGSIKIEQYNRYNYCNEYGWLTDEAQDKDTDVELKGKVTGSIGPKLDLKLAFLDDVMELGVEGNLKAELTAETETAEKEDPTGMKESIHKCDLCINGDLDGIFNIEFVLSLNVSEKTKLELAKYTFVEVKVHIADFYVSLINDTDSIHKGEVVFGLFEECPNRDYRVQFKLLYVDSETPVDEIMNVFVNASDGSGSHTISSDKHLYLKAGYYGACVVDNEDLGVSFLIQTKPLVVTVYAPEPDERSIYNKYLVNEGFDNLDVIKNMKSKYMQISSILVDLGGDERKELVLQVVNTQWSGPRGYETQYYLFTINNKNEVVSVADCYYSGGTMGGDDMFVYLDSATGKPVAVVNSVYREGIYANAVGLYIYTFNGTTAKYTSAYVANRLSVGTYYDSQISAIKKATSYYTVDSNNYFTYWTDLYDNYISKATYNSGYARYQESSKYDWVSGTVSVPIPKTE